MSLQAKLILPFVDNNISLDDITKESGFINMFLHNKNNPELDNHVFFMYEGKDLTEQNANVFDKFRKLKNFYKYKVIQVNNHAYRLYTFVLTNPLAKKIHRDQYNLLDKDDEINILKFWKLSDDEVNNHIFYVKHFIEKDNDSVPEEDYAEPFGKD